MCHVHVSSRIKIMLRPKQVMLHLNFESERWFGEKDFSDK